MNEQINVSNQTVQARLDSDYCSIEILPYRWDLYKRYLHRNLVGAEIGVGQGQNAINILQFAKPKKLYLVDIWNQEGYVHFAGAELHCFAQDKILFRGTFNSWDEYVRDVFSDEINDGKVCCIKKDGLSWLKQMPDNHLDFVYIDASHSMGEIEILLEESRRVLKPKGLFCGHDWSDVNVGQGSHRQFIYNIQRPLLNEIQRGTLRLLALSNDQNLPPSFVCQIK